MASKRRRIVAQDKESSKTDSDPKLEVEVYDLLLQSSRKELAHLLGVFVKACTPSILRQVRSEALKIGVTKENISAPFQTCNQSTLDSVFAFLDERDVSNLQPVCRRWRTACKVYNSGWIHALGRRIVCDDDLFREFALRRLPFACWKPVTANTKALTLATHNNSNRTQAIARISQFTALESLRIDVPLLISELDPLASLPHVTQLTLPAGCDRKDVSELKCLSSLTSLSMQGLIGQELGILSNLPLLQSLSCTAYPPSFTSVAPFSFPQLRSLSLDMRIGGFQGTELRFLATVSQLQTLSIQQLFFNEPELNIIGGLSQLTSLTLSGGCRALDSLSQLTGLTSLTINSIAGPVSFQFMSALSNLQSLVGSIPGSDSQALASLTSLPKLRSLKLRGRPATGVWQILAKLKVTELVLDCNVSAREFGYLFINKSLKTLHVGKCLDGSVANVRMNHPDVDIYCKPDDDLD